MKKSEISLAIMVLKYGLDYLQYLWDPLIAFFMAEFPSQAHFLGLTHVSGQKRAPGHGTPFCALVQPCLLISEPKLSALQWNNLHIYRATWRLAYLGRRTLTGSHISHLR